ncbi:MAG TPA: cation:proton antiporter family protein [Candidatus Paceibacterota bacterium]|nr:cation:proton antiporter family protein [Candidatus Paceibacterota bacterium]
MPTFLELSLILVLAALVSLVARLLRQPLIVGYIATGILVGPYALDLLHSRDEMELFSKIGISILLFIVGLTLNPEIVREVGRTSFITGMGQVAFTSVVGFFIIRFLGFDVVASVYAAIALTFSSTIIILKLLSDRGDTGKLYGKISVGFLLVQDLVATIVLLAATAFGAVAAVGGDPSGAAGAVGGELLRLFVWGGLISVVLYFVSKRILPKLVSYVGGNQEVLFIFSIAWGLGLASLFQVIGFSIEIGALIAGVMLAVSPFAYEIGSRMKPLRDFFILIFFILLGAQMVLTELSAILVPAVVLSLFVLVGNPLIAFLLMNLLGYRTKTSFMAGLTVAQISEFSLILAALGYSLGHIDERTVSLITLVGIITIAGSTYLILYADHIYAFLRRSLEALSIRKRHHREAKGGKDSPEVILFGYDRVGHEFVSVVSQVSGNYLVVDYNPQSIRRLEERGVPFRYGDAEDVEFLQEIGFQGARLVVSSIPDHATNLLLVRFYRKTNPSGIVIALAHRAEDAEELYVTGASYVVMPHHLGAHHAALMIARHGFEPAGFERERNVHLARLTQRK